MMSRATCIDPINGAALGFNSHMSQKLQTRSNLIEIWSTSFKNPQCKTLPLIHFYAIYSRAGNPHPKTSPFRPSLSTDASCLPDSFQLEDHHLLFQALHQSSPDSTTSIGIPHDQHGCACERDPAASYRIRQCLRWSRRCHWEYPAYQDAACFARDRV